MGNTFQFLIDTITEDSMIKETSIIPCLSTKKIGGLEKHTLHQNRDDVFALSGHGFN